MQNRLKEGDVVMLTPLYFQVTKDHDSDETYFYNPTFIENARRNSIGTVREILMNNATYLVEWKDVKTGREDGIQSMRAEHITQTNYTDENYPQDDL